MKRQVSQKSKFILLLISILGQIGFCLNANHTTWTLSDYNEWNLPFMKQAYMIPILNGEVKQEVFYEKNYNLEVDATAFFSILWQPNKPNYIKDKEMINLNYTFFGDSMFEATGIWAKANITITEEKDGQKPEIYNTDLVIFVAYG